MELWGIFSGFRVFYLWLGIWDYKILTDFFVKGFYPGFQVSIHVYVFHWPSFLYRVSDTLPRYPHSVRFLTLDLYKNALTWVKIWKWHRTFHQLPLCASPLLTLHSEFVPFTPTCYTCHLPKLSWNWNHLAHRRPVTLGFPGQPNNKVVSNCHHVQLQYPENAWNTFKHQGFISRTACKPFGIFGAIFGSNNMCTLSVRLCIFSLDPFCLIAIPRHTVLFP